MVLESFKTHFSTQKTRLYFTIWLPRETWISFSVDASTFCVSSFMKKFVYTWNNPQIKCRPFALHLVAFSHTQIRAGQHKDDADCSTSVGKDIKFQLTISILLLSLLPFPTSTNVGYEISNSKFTQYRRVKRVEGLDRCQRVLHLPWNWIVMFSAVHVIVDFDLGNRQRLHKLENWKWNSLIQPTSWVFANKQSWNNSQQWNKSSGGKLWFGKVSRLEIFWLICWHSEERQQRKVRRSKKKK